MKFIFTQVISEVNVLNIKTLFYVLEVNVLNIILDIHFRVL